jgi:hypothetical protein
MRLLVATKPMWQGCGKQSLSEHDALQKNNTQHINQTTHRKEREHTENQRRDGVPLAEPYFVGRRDR